MSTEHVEEVVTISKVEYDVLLAQSEILEELMVLGLDDYAIWDHACDRIRDRK